ncbi:hypothetical protein PoB_005820400 [Plakobranchus ocellatus]|uniref:Uncharacterized protein n=1 Tax=Plakobranchus ocellatus TaxID=259542 RepID=A0AAV4CG39_9GAST|nr:hypothetical protein PoB_005820400 [Plakobranchus ocellatus]
MFTLLSKTKTTRTEEPKEKDPNSGMTEERGSVIALAGAIVYKKMKHCGQLLIDKPNICIQVRQIKNYVQVPLNPQPQSEDVLFLSRYYAKHKSGAGYEKRVSFMHSEKFPALAVHEFKGCCPELKHHAYVRTKPQVIDKIKEDVIVKKVEEIYSSHGDVLEGPSNRRQIYNIKARSQTKG